MSSLPSTLFRRSLPGSASELRYPQGGSLPSSYSNATGGVVVRRTHHGRWGPTDGNKVWMVHQAFGPCSCLRSFSNLSYNFELIYPCFSMASGTVEACWDPGLRVERAAALTMRMTGRHCSDQSCCLPAVRQTYRLWPSCYRNNWRPLTRRLSESPLLSAFCEPFVGKHSFYHETDCAIPGTTSQK